jgi:hypothetical protein
MNIRVLFVLPLLLSCSILDFENEQDFEIDPNNIIEEWYSWDIEGNLSLLTPSQIDTSFNERFMILTFTEDKKCEKKLMKPQFDMFGGCTWNLFYDESNVYLIIEYYIWHYYYPHIDFEELYRIVELDQNRAELFLINQNRF